MDRDKVKPQLMEIGLSPNTASSVMKKPCFRQGMKLKGRGNTAKTIAFDRIGYRASKDCLQNSYLRVQFNNEIGVNGS